jgi:hypothetical protein
VPNPTVRPSLTAATGVSGWHRFTCDPTPGESHWHCAWCDGRMCAPQHCTCELAHDERPAHCPVHGRPAVSTVTTVYRFYDAAGDLLYVGISCNFLRRVGEHTGSADWIAQAVRCTLEHYSDRAEAEQAERVAIATEHPIHNATHQPMVFARSAELQAGHDLADQMASHGADRQAITAALNGGSL